MPRFTLFADVNRVVKIADDDDLALAPGEGMELEIGVRRRVRKPTIKKPPKLKPTVHVELAAGKKALVPTHALEGAPAKQPLVADVAAGREVKLDDLEPLRKQVHASGRDLVVLLTDRDG
jgi:hypothetical protein